VTKLFSSLRIRLILLVLLALVPVLGLILYTNLVQRQNDALAAQEETLRVVRLSIVEQAQLIEGARQLLLALSQINSVRGEAGSEGCQTLFANLLAQYPFYTGFIAARPNGDVFCSAPPLTAPVNFADRDWYQRLVESNDFVVSEYVIGRISGKATLVLAYPALDATGQLQTIVATGLDLTWLNRLVAEARLPAGSIFMVLDRQGTILAHDPNPEAWMGQTAPEAPLIQTILGHGQGMVEELGVDGVTRLYAFTPLSSTPEADPGVYVTIGIPTEVVFAEADQLLVRNLTLLGLVAALALITAWVGSDLLVLRQTRALLGATGRLAAGDLNTRTDIPYGRGELGQLAHAFDQMAEALEQREVQHKQAAEALMAAKAQLQQLLTANPAMIYSAEPGGDYAATFISENIKTQLGYEPQEILDNPKFWADHIHPEDTPRVFAGLPRLFEQGSLAHEYRFQHQDGTYRWMHDEMKLVRDEAGNPLELVGFWIDITERVQAEEALRESEEKFRTLAEKSPNMIFINQGGGIVYANEICEEIIGYSRAEFYSPDFDFMRLIAPESVEIIEENYRRHGQGQEVTPCELQLLTKDGNRLYSIYTTRLITYQGQPAILGIITDTTKRRQAEEEIRRRNKELELLNAIIAASAAGLEPEGVLEIACRSLARAFDVPQASAVLLNEDKTAGVVAAEYRVKNRPGALGQTIPIDDSPPFQYLLSRKTPLAVDDVQNDPRLAPVHDLIHQSGLVSMLILPLTIEGEVVGGLSLETIEPRHFSPGEISLAWNVADQVTGVLARGRLAQTHQRLITAIEQSVESVIITDTKGVILYVNPAFERVSGYSRAEAIGQTPRLLKSGKHDAAFYQNLWGTITAGQVWRGRLINKKKNGTLYTDEATITPVRNKRGEIVNFVAVQRDVTRELQLEEQYHQAQKMEAIGRLTGGIAHDFNNLLTAINGFAELLHMRLPLNDPHRKLAGNILNSGQRATGLVKQLLAFSRKQIVEPKVLDLNEVVANMDKMLRRIIGEDLEMITLLASDLWPVKVDPAQIEQVIINLAVNARDAMPEGGRLTIETANVILDDNYVAAHLEAQPDEQVLLAINDTGSGMSDEVQARIFEPFFTTKEQGKGTGLGLATVFGIVKQSGGDIRVYSEEGQGTTFKIYLPRAEEASPASIRSDQTDDIPRGTETVLLAEDEAAVRNLVAEMLRAQGYTVLEADNGEAGLRLAQEYKETIQLLLTDVIMPQMGGKELAERLSATRPEIKVLFVSGYTDNAIVHKGVLDPEVAFIQKPFSAVALARKVRAVLDG
jgi:PAS domain S-box-containing protein